MPMTPNAGNTHISTDWSDLLLPGLRSVFYKTLDEMPGQFENFFKVKTSTKAQEFELGMGDFSPWTERVNDTDNVSYQKIGEGLKRIYEHKEFAGGFAVGKRLHEDELYNIINQMPEDLARAGRSKLETDVASIFNNAFDASSAIYDGKALISDNHRYETEAANAGTGSNLVTGALSPTSIKNAIIKMRQTTDSAGKKILLQPDVLVVPTALEWYANELIKSPHIVDSPNNNINSLAGKLRVVAYDFLDDDKAWFIMDSNRHKLQFFWRVKPEFTKGNDTDNFVAKYNGRMRYSYGVSDWRGIVGSTGETAQG